MKTNAKKNNQEYNNNEDLIFKLIGIDNHDIKVLASNIIRIDLDS